MSCFTIAHVDQIKDVKKSFSLCDFVLGTFRGFLYLGSDKGFQFVPFERTVERNCPINHSIQYRNSVILALPMLEAFSKSTATSGLAGTPLHKQYSSLAPRPVSNGFVKEQMTFFTFLTSD
jgi:hypothetical protein